MNIFLSILVTLLLFVLGFGLYILIPFKNKKGQIIVTSIAVAIAVIMIFIPATFICSIKIPFLNLSADDMIHAFLESSEQYGYITKVTSDFGPKIISMVQNIIKSSVVFVIEGLILLFASLITTIIYLAKKKQGAKKRIGGAIFSNLGCMVMSVAFMFVPVYTISNIYVNMNNALGTGEEALYSKYPEFEKYAPILNMIDKISVISDGDLAISEIPLLASDAFSNGAASSMSKELVSVDLIMYHFEKSGMAKIYADSFKFSDTTSETFDFDEMGTVIDMTLDSELYSSISLAFLNDIATCFERQIELDTGRSDVDLQFTEEEFKAQYLELMDMLSFVIELDLINRLNGFFNPDNSYSDLFAQATSVAKDLLLDSNNRHRLLDKILEYQFIKDVGGYLGVEVSLVTAIYACMRLYTVMDYWKSEYTGSDLYTVSKQFLEAREML